MAKELFGEDLWNTQQGSLRQGLIKLSLLSSTSNKVQTYILALPKVLDSPMFWSEEEQEWLRGTNIFGEIQSKVELWREEYDLLKATVPSCSFTFEEYKWACGIFMSRAFPARIVYKDAESEDLTMLVPVVDSLNHMPNTSVYWSGNDGTGFTFSVCHEVESGSEVFNNYGPKSNEELLFGYGFYLKDAEQFDVVMLRLRVPEHITGFDASKDGSVVFQLSKTKDIDPKLFDLFNMLAVQYQFEDGSFSLAQQVTGLGVLCNALRQKLQTLEANQPLDVSPSDQESLRYQYAQQFRQSQKSILKKNIAECNSILSVKLSTASSTLDLDQVLGNDVYFENDVKPCLQSIFGMDTISEFDENGVHDQALCLVLAYERLKGTSSRYSNVLDAVWPDIKTVDEETIEMYQDLHESLFPNVLELDSDMFKLEGWTGQLLAEAGMILNQQAYTYTGGQLRVLFE